MDKFADYPTTLTAPARDATATTPNDAVDLPFLARALYVGETGHVSVRMAGGQTAVFANVPAGSFLPVRAQGINATGTTANSIVVLW